MLFPVLWERNFPVCFPDRHGKERIHLTAGLMWRTCSHAGSLCRWLGAVSAAILPWAWEGLCPPRGQRVNYMETRVVGLLLFLLELLECSTNLSCSFWDAILVFISYLAWDQGGAQFQRLPLGTPDTMPLTPPAKDPMWGLYHLPSRSFPNDSLVNLQSWWTVAWVPFITWPICPNSNRRVVMTLQVSRCYYQLGTCVQQPWRCLCIPLCLVHGYPRKRHASLSGGLEYHSHAFLPQCFKNLPPENMAFSSILGSWVQKLAHVRRLHKGVLLSVSHSSILDFFW